jgi:WD40 repeat protein
MITHQSPISCVSSLPGQYLLTAGYDNQLILWDAISNVALARAQHDHLVNQCTFSPCGQYAASTSSDYSARLWHVPSLQLHSVLLGHSDDVEAIAFHPTEAWVATSSRDGTICVFNYAGRRLHQLFGHCADVISVQWLGDQLVSSSDDGTVKRWCGKTGVLLEDISLGGVETDTIAISEDGLIYAGNDDGEIILIDGHNTTSVQAHAAGIKKLCYAARYQTLVSLSYDRTLKLWRRDEGKLVCLKTTTYPEIVWARSCDFISDDVMVFATFGDRAALYDLSTDIWSIQDIHDTRGLNAVFETRGDIYTVGDSGHVLSNAGRSYRLPGLCNFIMGSGTTLLAGGQAGAVYEVTRGVIVYQHHSPLNCAVSYVYQGATRVLIGAYTGEVVELITHSDASVELSRILRPHQNAIKGLAVHDGVLMSVCADASAAFHRLSDFKCLNRDEQAHRRIANGCDASKQGRFVSVSRDLKLRLWEHFEAREISSPSQHSLKCVAISADGNFVCVGNYSGQLGLYHVPSEQWVFWQRISSSGISSVIATDQGAFLFTSYDGKLRRLRDGEIERICFDRGAA